MLTEITEKTSDMRNGFEIPELWFMDRFVGVALNFVTKMNTKYIGFDTSLEDRYFF